MHFFTKAGTFRLACAAVDDLGPIISYNAEAAFVRIKRLGLLCFYYYLICALEEKVNGRLILAKKNVLKMFFCDFVVFIIYFFYPNYLTSISFYK